MNNLNACCCTFDDAQVVVGVAFVFIQMFPGWQGEVTFFGL